MNHRVATIISGLSLIIPGSMGLLITGYPTILHPFPVITVLPAFYLASAHLWMVCAINVAWIVVLATSILFCRKKNSFASNLIFHWLLFAWLGWFAFPCLGEMP